MRSVLSLLLAASLAGGCGDGETTTPPHDLDDGSICATLGLWVLTESQHQSLEANPLVLGVAGDAMVVGASALATHPSCFNEHGSCDGGLNGGRFVSGRSLAPDVVAAAEDGPSQDIMPGWVVQALKEGEAPMTFDYVYRDERGICHTHQASARVRALPIQTFEIERLRCVRPNSPPSRGSAYDVLPPQTREIARFETDTVEVDLRGSHPAVETLSLYGATIDSLFRLEGDLQVKLDHNPFASDKLSAGVLRGEASGVIHSVAADWSLAVRRISPGEVDGMVATQAPPDSASSSRAPWLRLRAGGADVCSPIQAQGADVMVQSKTPEVCRVSSEHVWSYLKEGVCEATVTYLPGDSGRGVQQDLSFEVTQAQHGPFGM